MSISSEITRITSNVSDSFSAVTTMGGTVPAGANSDDLAGAILSIPPATSYSPIKTVSTASYDIIADDNGKTLQCTYSGAVSVTLSNEVASALPQGAEIALIKSTNHAISITIGSNWFLASPGALGAKGRTLTCPTGYQLMALKKVGTNWFVASGNFS